MRRCASNHCSVDTTLQTRGRVRLGKESVFLDLTRGAIVGVLYRNLSHIRNEVVDFIPMSRASGRWIRLDSQLIDAAAVRSQLRATLGSRDTFESHVITLIWSYFWSEATCETVDSGSETQFVAFELHRAVDTEHSNERRAFVQRVFHALLS